MGDPKHRLVLAGVRPKPARRTQHLPGISGLDRHRRLVRVHPDDHTIHHSLLARPIRLVSEDGHRYFELSRPFLSHASLRRPTGPHAMKEPHPTQVGSRDESVRPGTSLEPAPARAVMEDISSRGQGVEDGRTEHGWNSIGHRRRREQTFAACDLR